MPCLAGLAGQNLAEQGFAADRLQRPLLRRSRFQRRLKPGVRAMEKESTGQCSWGHTEGLDRRFACVRNTLDRSAGGGFWGG